MEDLISTKRLILEVLAEHPETRDSDTLLYLYCCRKQKLHTIEDMIQAKLNIISIHKIRQIIQNKEGKFLPSETVQKKRREREKTMRTFFKGNPDQMSLF